MPAGQPAVPYASAQPRRAADTRTVNPRRARKKEEEHACVDLRVARKRVAERISVRRSPWVMGTVAMVDAKLVLRLE